MDTTVLLVFAFVYLGMILGRVPGLALDRTGVALLGAILLVALGKLSPRAAWEAVDVPTIGLLFGLMVVSAQFRLGGLYTALTRRITEAELSPGAILGLTMAAAGLLSALLVNDIICLAMAPILIEVCARRDLDPEPLLLGLAVASNVGSAATLIGNPQNILIGETLELSFSAYLLDAGLPAALGLAASWWIIRRRYRLRWRRETAVPEVEAPPFDAWQTVKGLCILTFLVVVFLASDWPRDVLALAAAGVILTSRRMHSRRMLGQVDWQLIVLFVGLFVVNRALLESSTLSGILDGAGRRGIAVAHPASLFVLCALLSNLVSNVPSVMLLLPVASAPEAHPLAGSILALSSTLAGNLLLVGSIANIIVVNQAAACGIRITWGAHARIGAPITLATLAIAAAWLWVRASWSS